MGRRGFLQRPGRSSFFPDRSNLRIGLAKFWRSIELEIRKSKKSRPFYWAVERGEHRSSLLDCPCGCPRPENCKPNLAKGHGHRGAISEDTHADPTVRNPVCGTRTKASSQLVVFALGPRTGAPICNGSPRLGSWRSTVSSRGPIDVRRRCRRPASASRSPQMRRSRSCIRMSSR